MYFNLMCFKGETATFIKHFFVIFFGFYVDDGIAAISKTQKQRTRYEIAVFVDSPLGIPI